MFSAPVYRGPANSMLKLDEIDKKLIVYLQEDFPLVMAPFKELGKRLSLSENEVIARVKKLKDSGIIKRIGITHNPQNLGYKRALVGLAVPKEKIEEVVRVVNAFSEITHNYLRDDPKFNLWFTLICPTQKKINEIIREIKRKIGIKDMVNLPTVRTIKIKTVFKP